MAICQSCRCEYDPKEAEYQFDHSRSVRKRGLAGAYINVRYYCGDCAVRIGCESYDQGMEDLSYRWGDDD